MYTEIVSTPPPPKPPHTHTQAWVRFHPALNLPLRSDSRSQNRFVDAAESVVQGGADGEGISVPATALSSSPVRFSKTFNLNLTTPDHVVILD